MKKIIVFLGFLAFVLSSEAQFRRTVTDEGSYFKVAVGLTDTILVEKSKILYVRQEASQVSLVMFGYGGQNVSIKVDTAGWSSGSVNQFVEDLTKSVKEDVSLSSSLTIGTQKLVNGTFTVNSDSAFVYLSFQTYSGNVNNCFYKGSYGVWLPIEKDKVQNWENNNSIIPEYYIKSIATTDTVFIVTWKK